MMKKIGLFLESGPGGGTFQYHQIMLDAVASLPKERYSVVVGYTSDLWLQYLKGYELTSVFVPRGFWGRAAGVAWNLTGLPMGVWRNICPAFHPMARILLKEKCDLWIFPSQDGRGFQFPIPALVSIHDLMHRYEKQFPESASWWQFPIRERNYENVCRWAKGVLVDSGIGRQQVVECYGMPAERIHVLPYTAPKYMRTGETLPGFDARYRLPDKFIFYPARFWEHKNHKRLIAAVARLKDELPDLKLVLVGLKDKSYSEVIRLVRRSGLAGDVVFPGYVGEEDMREFYSRARALIMPTFYGPTNIPPLEAFVAGCPVAVSDIYGMPEQVGDAGLLFDPHSVNEIAECIRRLWVDDGLCIELAERGKKRAAAWDQRHFNERLGQIIEKVLEVEEKPGEGKR